MLDLSPMKLLRVDPQTRRALVEPGATLDVNSTTSLVGLTLRGGFGWLSRKHGMSVDNLLSVDVDIAGAKLVRASMAVAATFASPPASIIFSRIWSVQGRNKEGQP
jgi:FAD/FMN-containing dehydrogenase